jgi:Fe-S-cluster containining protein
MLLAYVTVSVSDIIRILNNLREDVNNWQKYFNLLIDEKRYWYHSCILELKEGSSGNCIFFDIEIQLCKIHSFKPWKCSRYYCKKFLVGLSTYEEFYKKHGLTNMINEDYEGESRFNNETAILKEVVALYKKTNSIEKVKQYLKKDLIEKSRIKLQQEQIDMFTQIVLRLKR